MQNSSKNIYLLAKVKVQAGELSYPLRRVVMTNTGNIDFALNFLNDELKQEFLSDPTDTEYASHEHDDVPDWKKGFWHDDQHTIQITDFLEIPKEEYEILEKHL